MEITIANSQRKIRLNQKRIKAVSEKILKILKLPPQSAISISFVGKTRIASLNKRYLRKDRATDIITLGYKCDKAKLSAYRHYIGDIFICPEVASRNSRIYGNDLFAELKLYIIHGMLHLLGYADRLKKDRDKMWKAEEEVFKKL